MNAQIITPSVDSITASPGDAVTFDVTYTTDPLDDSLTGLTLRMHYDSSQLAYGAPTNLLGSPTVQDQADTDDFDNDPNTDRFVLFLWFDLNGQWPGGPLPTRLYTANFTTTQDFAGTQINFSGQPAIAWQLNVTPVNVTAQNELPDAIDDAAATDEDTPVDIDVLSNDTDPDGDPLTVTAVTQPANGQTAINADGTVRYTPDAGFTGQDTFQYTVSDDNGGEDTATVTVTVNPVLRHQIITPDPAELFAGSGVPVQFDVTYATDPLDNSLTGLTLRMHYDSSQLAYEVPTNLLGSPTVQDQADTDDFDNDPSTDRFVLFLWFDVNGQWPGGPLPTRLYTANFTTTQDFAGTQVNFSGQPAIGWQLETTPVDVQSGALLRGVKWNDMNGDGVRDVGEPEVDGWTIYLDVNQNGQLDPGEPETVTRADDPDTPEDETGTYKFTGLEPGSYTVREVEAQGWRQTAPEPVAPGEYRVTVQAGEERSGLDFGNFELVTLSGTKFEDINGNGQRDAGEPGLAEWTIQLDLHSDGTIDETVVTDQDGNYVFTDVGPGTHTVSEVLPAGWLQTAPAEGTYEVTPQSGQDFADLDFGNQGPPAEGAIIRGIKWNDLNGDGVRDPDEPGLAGWTIYLDLNGNGRLDDGEPQTVTQDDDPATPEEDETGQYAFAFVGLEPGTYSVCEVMRPGWEVTQPGTADWQVLDVVSTGFDEASGQKVGSGRYDTDWRIGMGGTGGFWLLPVRSVSNIPDAWIDDGASGQSRWVSPTTNTRAPGGTYFYQTTVDLTAEQAPTARLRGLRFAADDTLLAIWVNDTQVYTPEDLTAAHYLAFQEVGEVGAGAFVAGRNTIRFELQNSGPRFGRWNPTGLRVEATLVAATGPVVPSQEVVVSEGQIVDGVDFGNRFGPIALPDGGGRFVWKRDGDDVVLRRESGEELGRWPIATLPHVLIQGSAAADHLIVDFSGGDPVPSEGLTINAGGGRDFIWVQSPESGFATGIILDGGDDADTLIGSSAADTLIGGPGNDRILGMAGNDSIEGGDGVDLLRGYDGDDTLAGGNAGDLILGSGGNDLLDGGFGNDTMFGQDDDDSLFGSAGRDLLFGGSGNDYAKGQGSSDTLYGHAGQDTLIGDVGHDSLFAGDGDDSVDGGRGRDRIYGGSGNDWLTGGDGRDTIKGGNGDDEIDGGAGRDRLFGEAGNDCLTGRDDGDTLLGGAGNDTSLGGPGDDRLGADPLGNGSRDDPGEDVLLGEEGDDTIDARDGEADTVTGGGNGVDPSPGDTLLTDPIDTVDEQFEAFCDWAGRLP
ncbi:MAG: hypothetical protein GXP27_21425 [Planctomycetes bacterium]|nr:hypothetical protein [Planctomycetota bacterium]